MIQIILLSLSLLLLLLFLVLLLISINLFLNDFSPSPSPPLLLLHNRIFTRVASKISPESARALLNDRDEHMCGGLLDLKGETTVAIVGMGKIVFLFYMHCYFLLIIPFSPLLLLLLAHMDGIEAEWKKRSGLA